MTTMVADTGDLGAVPRLNLSFNIGASVARARQIIEAYKQRGVGPERVLIKLASTWEAIADGQDAGAHSAFGRRYLTPIECMSKGNF